ncbi:MAG: ATP phosphoribosyltransferase [Alphaproteobacteria bacterium]|nr:ATP phosphoribosyltransferase [Alphaproteobacteria bacterium]
MSQLILAVPSKGRLEESASALFTKAGIGLNRAGARGYTGTIQGIEQIEVQYLSASEIAARLADGSIHFGITGEDLLREEVPDLDSAVQLVLGLGFGRADVVVAIPDGWVDVRTMADLAEVAAEFRAKHAKRLRVATKYTNLTADFFAEHGVTDYKLVESFGATEAAPNSGAAEAIVDITSTGATLVANQLRIPDDGVMLQSEANLAASLKANWDETARAASKRLLSRLAAYNRAEELVHVTLSSSGGMAEPRLRRETIVALLRDYNAVEDNHLAGSTSTGGSFYGFQLPRENQDAFIEAMLKKGFSQASVSKLDFVYKSRNALYEHLISAVV